MPNYKKKVIVYMRTMPLSLSLSLSNWSTQTLFLSLMSRSDDIRNIISCKLNPIWRKLKLDNLIDTNGFVIYKSQFILWCLGIEHLKTATLSLCSACTFFLWDWAWIKIFSPCPTEKKKTVMALISKPAPKQITLRLYLYQEFVELCKTRADSWAIAAMN